VLLWTIQIIYFLSPLGKFFDCNKSVCMVLYPCKVKFHPLLAHDPSVCLFGSPQHTPCISSYSCQTAALTISSRARAGHFNPCLSESNILIQHDKRGRFEMYLATSSSILLFSCHQRSNALFMSSGTETQSICRRAQFTKSALSICCHTLCFTLWNRRLVGLLFIVV
jgi:hypothetical protein